MTTENKLLTSYGFEQGDDQQNTTCDDCDKACNGNRSWWRRVSYEYDEWEVKCRACAFAYCKMYENFDIDEYMRIVNDNQPAS